MIERAYLDTISGTSRGILPSAARSAFWAASHVYRGVIARKNLQYDVRVTSGEIGRAPVPVVSVGNLTAGGTGKTPVVGHLAQLMTSWGYRVGLISRGYSSRGNSLSESDAGNDEKRVLRTICPQVPHWQHRDRVAAAKHACQVAELDVLILDDGFQHRRLHRDVNIVLIDATNPWGYGHLLPRGLLREPLSSLRRADIVLLTRCDAVSQDDVSNIKKTIALHHQTVPILETSFPVVGLRNAHGQTQPVESLALNRVGAFCGIGNPVAFRKTLSASGFEPAWLKEFGDHHAYTALDLARLIDQLRDEPVDAVLCTLKDLVKIERTTLGETPLWSVEIGTTFSQEPEEVIRALRNVLPERGSVAA
ncbi:tetraacyldisaccharide 4'-kinase [Stratiformator vulcanicus]|uniref:Tetraacyldisaccharide 4'-kinase n=1 Tax=Stratiformator vulcanicus TaxID=2527980 RepID=A0A517R1U2_9PLAN|nr:tetraacyldisaccharide 4'-kinase [Stratiformator vulcanicus]QDT37857.1 Tetraacyldisaccharide 4'-kinase [Stratiformator vulcanicus]